MLSKNSSDSGSGKSLALPVFVGGFEKAMSCFKENDERERDVSIDAIDRESAANAPAESAKRDCPRASDARRSRLRAFPYLSAFEMKRHDIAGEYPRAHLTETQKKLRAKKDEMKYPSRPRVAVASSYLSTLKVPHVPNNFRW